MGVWAVDLFGRGGIQHNGVPVRHAMISEGDELLVGRSTIQLRHEHAVAPDFSRDQAAGNEGAGARNIWHRRFLNLQSC